MQKVFVKEVDLVLENEDEVVIIIAGLVDKQNFKQRSFEKYKNY